MKIARVGYWVLLLFMWTLPTAFAKYYRRVIVPLLEEKRAMARELDPQK